MRHGILGLALALATGASGSAAHATELDLRGSWQISIDCSLFPFDYGQATSFLTIDEDLGTGELSTTIPECGTLQVPGQIRRVTTCPTTPSPVPGQITGTSFASPEVGSFSSDAKFATAFPFPLLGCAQVARIFSELQYVGTASDDGFGVADGIAGTLVTGPLEFRDQNGDVCFSVGSGAPDCAFEMLRNEAPAGVNVTVRPRSGATVEFAQVDVAGTASITPLTEADATLPANFQTVGGNIDLYFDVETTAAVSGAITTCFTYPDADQDGIVDGSSPPLPESDVRVLHDEGGVFVDRTASLDPVANVACAETTSLSQYTIGGDPSGAPPAPVPASGSTATLALVLGLLASAALLLVSRPSRRVAARERA